jgi:DNA-binding MarR family transcriptional regulator
MSIMDDKAENPSDVESIRTLVYFLGLVIDHQFRERRRGTLYERVRPSDIRVFVKASHKPATISNIARELRISRQAAHKSLIRLQELGVVEVLALEGNRRDKQVKITRRGRMAGTTAAHQTYKIECGLAEVLGEDVWRSFHDSIKKLVQAFAKDLQKSNITD